MVELIPRQVLFGNPERIGPALAPDGRSLAWIAPHDGVLNLWVTAVGTGGPGGVDLAAARVVTDDRERGIHVFTWAPAGGRLIYLQDRGGDENWRLYDVDLETMARRDLTPLEGVQAQIIAAHPSVPGSILVGLNRDNPELHDVYRLDLASGVLDKELENPGFVDWLADSSLVVRAAVAPQPDGAMVVVVRDGAGGDWRPIHEAPADDALSIGLVAIDEHSLLLLSSVGAEATRLVRLALDASGLEVLASDPEADVVAVRLHPVSEAPQLAVLARDRLEYVALDDAVAGDLERVRAVEAGDPMFLGGDDGDSTWLVGFTHDDAPLRYYSYDRPARKASFLFEHKPALASYQLAKMEPFSFAARDGLVLHGYATFPPGSAPPGSGRPGHPAVLLVHGGPWARDSWGLDPMAQWMANRGYLCLQVNYRGSTGYGKAFLNAGDKQWGAKMQDDLVDTVSHAVAAGWADGDRVAIFGGSYGGYAALVGAAFTPEVFCCAVDIVGPANLLTLIETIPPYWAPLVAQFHRRVGDPATDSEMLWQRSPLSRASEIRIPLLIAQGANDPRVKVSESTQIVEALERAGIDHEYMLFPDEGHGFAKPENRLRFFAAAERFLARHLGGRCEE